MSMNIPTTKDELEEYERISEKYSKLIDKNGYYIEVAYS